MPSYDVTSGRIKASPDSSKMPAENTNCFLRIIQKHYTVTPRRKSEAEVEREKWLIRNWILFNRWFSMPAAFILQFCCGSLYSWSVFNKPIDLLMYGSNANIAPRTFYVAIGFYGSAAGLAGPWLEQTGPRTACLVGASLVLFGNLLTALALHLRFMWLVFIGYGCFVGVGFGICYISPVSALQKWFPDMRGLGAGFATCGFGAGSIVVSKMQLPLIHHLGLPLTFVTLGVIFIVLMTISALILRTPPPNYIPGSDKSEKPPLPETVEARSVSPDTVGEKVKDTTLNYITESYTGITESGKPPLPGTELGDASADTVDENVKDTTLNYIPSSDFGTADSGKPPLPETVEVGSTSLDIVDEKIKDPTLIDAVASSQFRIMYLMFVGDIIFGLVLASRLANIVIDVFGKTPEEASTVVSVNGAVNFIGRLLFSISSDYIGRKNCFILMLTSQVVILGCFSTMTNARAFVAFWISTSIITATYGAAFGVIPAFLADKFGSTNIGPCHGLFIAGWAAGGVLGGSLFTVIFDAFISAGYSPTDPFVYNANAWWLFGVACIGWIAIHFVTPSQQDRRFNNYCKRFICKRFS